MSYRLAARPFIVHSSPSVTRQLNLILFLDLAGYSDQTDDVRPDRDISTITCIDMESYIVKGIINQNV